MRAREAPEAASIDRERELRRRIDQLEGELCALRASEAKHRALYELTSDAVMLLDERSFFDCNQATLRMFGCSSLGEFLDRHPGELSPEFQPDGRDSRSAADERIRTAFREGSHRFEWLHCRLDGTPFAAEVLLSAMDLDGRRVLEAVVRDISERKRAEEELRAAHVRTESLLASLSALLVEVDAAQRVVRWNVTAETTLGVTAEGALGRRITELGVVWPRPGVPEALEECQSTGEEHRLEDHRYRRPDGQEKLLQLSLNPVRGASDAGAVVIVGTDVTARRSLELSLAHAQKLESIGRLAAGIAHEINTPTQFVSDNARFLKDGFSDVLRVLALLDRIRTAARAGGVPPGLLREAEEVRESVDLDFLQQEIPLAIDQSLEGLGRIAGIVRAMKELSHPDSGSVEPTDLNRAIESTVTVARNEWKYVAELEMDLDSTLPLVPCRAGDINQIVLNLIVNAAHAIGDLKRPDKGTITVATERLDRWAEIRISDTGTGIPEEVRANVFDPFFTTKEVGRGTGQGLALAHSVVERHGGTITFETEVGRGTTFRLRLPLEAPPAAGPA